MAFDTGFIYVFSVGWRRAMFYDLSPLAPNDPKEREYDVSTALAQFYTYLMFQRRFKIADQTWQRLFEGQWFPFITLKDSTVRNLIDHAANSWPLDDLSEAIAGEVRGTLPAMLLRWKTTQAFADHIEFLENASKQFLSKDFLCTSAILFPRIEGILRSHQKLTDPGGQATQTGLADSAVKMAENQRHQNTPLLPRHFQEYLEKVYFANFDPHDPKIKISRNSVGHGVVPGDECNIEAAVISLLLVDQLCYLVSKPSESVPLRSSTCNMPRR
jgi:hypothetical protein